MVKIIAKKKQWQWYQRQKLSLGFIGRTERLQNHGRPFEGNRKEHPVFSPGRRRKKVSGIKTFTTRIGFKVATYLTLKNLHGCRIFFSLQWYFWRHVFGQTRCRWDCHPARYDVSLIKALGESIFSIDFLRICWPFSSRKWVTAISHLFTALNVCCSQHFHELNKIIAALIIQAVLLGQPVFSEKY